MIRKPPREHPRRLLAETEPDGQFFSDLVNLLVPDNGFAALLSAYLDASSRKSGVFCVSGLAYGRDRAIKAASAWRGLWGGTICHMTDLHSRKSGFEQWLDFQAAMYLKQSVKIVNKHVSYAASVSCDLAEVEALAPTSAAPGSIIYLDGFRRAYAVCCHLVMLSLANLVRDHGRQPHISYFIETGDQHQAESQRFIAMSAVDPHLRETYGYRSHTLASKRDIRLLETADIMAWEWAKQRDRVREGMHTRPSLKALLDPDRSGYWSDSDFASSSRRALHVTGEPLERFFYKIKHLVLS